MLLDPGQIVSAVQELVEPAVASAARGSNVDLMLGGQDRMAEIILSWRPAELPDGVDVAPLPERPWTIIETHGGTLVRQTEPGGVCRLAIQLPVVPPAIQVDDLTAELDDESGERHLRVLLVEDSPMSRKLTSTLLEKRGYSVTAVANGREAVNAFMTGTYNLVLMDIQMPQMDGFDAAETIRRLDSGRGRHIPIVALTASDFEMTLDRCLAAGMDGMLNKPFRSEEFDLLLKQLKAEEQEVDRAERAETD
jgi:CheY-like chemotaxis protein